MVKFFIIVLGLAFIMSCGRISGDDPVDWQELIVNCIPSEYPIKEYTYCDSSINFNPSFICEYVNLGEIFLLPDIKEHSKYMCSLMLSVTFENEVGDELIFKKTAFAAQYATQWSEICPNDPNKSKLLCSANEEATAILINDSLGLEFRIILNVEDRDSVVSNDDRDRLSITVPREADFGVYFTLVLSYYIKRGNIYESFNPNYIYKEQFELRGRTYPEVTYFIPEENSRNQMEIYYSVKFGIIGFRDEGGTLWTFKKFG
jgi:hypothetical protein